MQVKTTMQRENPYINNLQKRTDTKWKNVLRSDKTTFQIVVSSELQRKRTSAKFKR